jgi:hypothetical protein
VTKKKRAQSRARHQLKRGNLIGLRLFSPIRKSYPLPVVALPTMCFEIVRGESRTSTHPHHRGPGVAAIDVEASRA